MANHGLSLGRAPLPTSAQGVHGRQPAKARGNTCPGHGFSRSVERGRKEEEERVVRKMELRAVGDAMGQQQCLSGRGAAWWG